MIRKILIANRGEIAVRIIRTCEEMGIVTVAVYSDADEKSLHVALADEAIRLGPAPPTESYLAPERILAAAQATGCDAIHPGYGFLSENADFAAQVRAANLIFVGPTPEAIRTMGSKTAARSMMEQAGISVVPGYHVRDDDGLEDLKAVAATIGYPLLIKAVAGGGGKGMRLVNRTSDLAEAISAARREALNAFGDDQIFFEKYITRPHHIEFQVFGDMHGNIIHLFERECSIQRRHQKIIEETPSPLLDASLRERMSVAALAAAQAVNYVNAGTVEFLADEAGNFYFLEMNTRLQVEHPITELITGIDLVRWQILVAAGQSLPLQQKQVRQRGHAIQCRIYAEDPANDFLPDIGKLRQVVEPHGPGIRVDSGIQTNDEVTIHYDPLLAKLMVFAENRALAIQKMARALRRYVILGVTTNIGFLQEVLTHPQFEGGNTTTDFIPAHFVDWPTQQDAGSDLAFIVAALTEYFGDTPIPTGLANIDAEGRDIYSPWHRLGSLRLGVEDDPPDEN